METESTGDVDKVTEKRMAELIGCTKRALEHRRQEVKIPEGVWMKHGGRIIYSKKRYDEWLESQWIYPEGSKSSAAPSAYVSHGMVSVDVKRSPIPRHKKGSRLHPSFAIR
ncbi:HTH_17 domain-containing protein [Pseudomonas soli]